MSVKKSWNQGVTSLFLITMNLFIFATNGSLSPINFFFYRNFVAKGPIHVSFKVVNIAKESIISEVVLIAYRKVSHQ
jgi:hypothetical protein